MSQDSILRNLVPQNLLPLSPAEKKVLDAAEGDGEAWCSTAHDRRDNQYETDDSDNWDNGREVRAELLRWLLLSREAVELITPTGLGIVGAKIINLLDLSFAKIPFSLGFEHCSILEGLNLYFAETGTLTLEGSRIAGGITFADKKYSVLADGVTVHGSLVLTRARITGRFSLAGAHIEEHLWCRSSTFSNPDGVSLCANGSRVDGTVLLDNEFNSTGEVSFTGSKVGGTFRCIGGSFKNAGGVALGAERIAVAGHVALSDEFLAEGEIKLSAAAIGGSLYCHGARFINDGAAALRVDFARVSGNLIASVRNLDTADCGMYVLGQFNLTGSTIGGNLDLSGGTYTNPDTSESRCRGAVVARGIEVGGSVGMRDPFKSQGEVSFLGARITRNFSSVGGAFSNPSAAALCLDDARIDGYLKFAERSSSYGTLSLKGARVGGDADFRGASLEVASDSSAACLIANGARVAGSVLLSSIEKGNAFSAKGEVSFAGAAVGRHFRAVHGSLSNPNLKAYALRLSSAEIGGDLRLDYPEYIEAHSTNKPSPTRIEGALQVTGARIGGDLVLAGAEVRSGSPDSTQTKLWLDGASVGGNFDARSVAFGGNGPITLDAQNLNVRGRFFWSRFKGKKQVHLDLRNARVGTLVDDEESWEIFASLQLEHFVYEALGAEAPKDSQSRLRWLELWQPRTSWSRQFRSAKNSKHGFNNQPYEQLAKVLREAGHDRDATEVTLAKEIERSRANNLIPRYNDRKHRFFSCVYLITVVGILPYLIFQLSGWSWLFGAVILAIAVGVTVRLPNVDKVADFLWSEIVKWGSGFGLRRRLPVYYAVGVLVASAYVFSFAYQHKLIVHTYGTAQPIYEADHGIIGPVAATSSVESNAAPACPEFHPFLYSLDTFLNLFTERGLDQGRCWRPDLSASEVFRLPFHRQIRFWAGDAVLYYVWVEEILGGLILILFVAALAGVLRNG